MRQAFHRLRRAAPYALGIHAVRSAMALGLAWPLLQGLGAADDASFFRAHPTGTDASFALEILVSRFDARWTMVWAGCHLLLSPLLALLWLHALDGANGLSSTLTGALRLYPRALALVPLAMLAALLLGLPAALLLAGQPLVPESLQEALALLAGLLAAGAIITAFALHDLVRAALVARGRLRVALRGVVPLASLRVLAVRAALWALWLLLALAGDLSARALPDLALALPAQQTAAFAQTLVGGLWLAFTLECIRRRDVPASAVTRP